MLKENNLYKKIIDLLVNIFNSNDLKKAIVENEILRKNIVLQINNLFYLEKQHNTKLNEVCYAVEFAQVLVNLTEKEEVIEKHDNKLVSQIEEDYLFLLDYLVNQYGQEKEKMNVASNINTILLKDLWQINEPSPSKPSSVKPEIIEVSDFKNHQNHNSQGRNNLSLDEIKQYLKFSGSLPIHPKSDPRFYPFKTKPKHMPMLKKLLTILISITLIFYFAILFYTAAKNISIDKHLLPSSFDKIWINKTTDRVLFSSPSNMIDYDYDYYYGSTQEKLNIRLETLFLFLPAFLILFATISCGYHLLTGQNKMRNKFSINWYIIAFIFINLILVFCYWVFKLIFYRFEVTSEKESEDNMALQFSKAVTMIIKNSDVFKLTEILTIIGSIMVGITFSFLIYLTFINPRIDTSKIKKANLEYEKMLYSAFKGKQYIIDADLFKE